MEYLLVSQHGFKYAELGYGLPDGTVPSEKIREYLRCVRLHNKYKKEGS